MNEIGELQLIWIRRLAKETERIRILKECDKLTLDDINNYRKSLSQIDEFCKSTIQNKSWKFNEIEKDIEEVETELFIHFYNIIQKYENSLN